MNCPDCDGSLKQISVSRSKFFLASCLNCSALFLVDSETLTTVHRETIHICEQIPENIPPLELGTAVIIINKQHSLFLDQGVIEEKKHLHYRIKMISVDKKLNGFLLWVPHHWVQELPKEFLRSDEQNQPS